MKIGKLSSGILRPGAGAATYASAKATQELSKQEASPSLRAGTAVAATAITAGFALAAATATPAIGTGLAAAMALAFVLPVDVMAGLYATGQMTDSEFDDITEFLDAIGSFEGLSTLATALSTGLSLKSAIILAKGVSAAKGAYDAYGSFKRGSAADGYLGAKGIGDLIDFGRNLANGGSNKPVDRNNSGKTSRGEPGDRGFNGVAERALERMERNRDSRGAGERQGSAGEKNSPRGVEKPGKGEMPTRGGDKGTEKRNGGGGNGGVKVPKLS